MTDENKAQRIPNPDVQLESAIVAVVSQPVDQEAVNRVKVRAKELAFTSQESDSANNAVKVSIPVEPKQSNPNKIPFKRSFWMSAVAASLILAVGLSMLLFENKTAFAKAIETLQTATTLSFMMEIDVEFGDTNSGGLNVDSLKGQVFVAEDGRWRFQTDDAVVVIDAKGNGLVLDKSTKEANTLTANEVETADFNYLDWFEKLKACADKPVKRLGKKTLSGIEVEGFVVVEPQETGELTIWVDTKSNQLVQVELEASEDDVVVKMIINDLKYDVPLKDSLFNLEVPVGYTVGADIPDVDSTEAFVDGLRKLTTNLDGVFPESLTEPKFDMTDEKAMEGYFAIGMFLHSLEGNDYEYVGAGKTRDGERSLVFWYRKDGKLQAIYSDLTVAEISKDEIPTK